ncbi:MAG: GNAT family N-acetyltransferase [Gammaproteobacteria bacterium]
MSEQPLLDETLRIAVASWEQHRSQLEQVRRSVFIDEQGVPAEIELDGEDIHCQHLLALDCSEQPARPVGTVRLLRDGRIGRLAVLKGYRRRGVGRQLLLEILQAARQRGHDTLYLHAQSQAQGFYTALGFQVEGDEFLEAGIPHINMVRKLSPE